MWGTGTPKKAHAPWPIQCHHRCMSGSSILRAVGLLLSLTVWAAETPTFTPSSVLPANATRPEPLRRFMLVSIYGRHLGPDSGCTAERGAFSEPVELCGASVTIGGTKAALLPAAQSGSTLLDTSKRAPIIRNVKTAWFLICVHLRLSAANVLGVLWLAEKSQRRISRR